MLSWTVSCVWENKDLWISEKGDGSGGSSKEAGKLRQGSY